MRRDLEEMAELVEALESMKIHGKSGRCDMCPLYYPNGLIHDECMQIHHSMFDMVHYGGVQCRKVRDRKIEEIARYMLERSLKDE